MNNVKRQGLGNELQSSQHRACSLFGADYWTLLLCQQEPAKSNAKNELRHQDSQRRARDASSVVGSEKTCHKRAKANLAKFWLKPRLARNFAELRSAGRLGTAPPLRGLWRPK